MANIHQTLKRVEALYAALLGTREEITRCVEELQRWQQEQRALRREVAEETRQAALSTTESLKALAEAAKQHREILAAATPVARREGHSFEWSMVGTTVVPVLLGVLIGFIALAVAWICASAAEPIDLSWE